MLLLLGEKEEREKQQRNRRETGEKRERNRREIGEKEKDREIDIQTWFGVSQTWSGVYSTRSEH